MAGRQICGVSAATAPQAEGERPDVTVHLRDLPNGENVAGSAAAAEPEEALF